MTKRKRSIHDIDTDLVEIYEDLANEDNEVRLKSAKLLCTQYFPRNVFDRRRTIEIVRRLIRGLCSGRKAARLGFSVALVEYLSQVSLKEVPSDDADGMNVLSVDTLLDLVRSQTKLTGDIAGQEQRDHCFGRLFACEAIIKSCAFRSPSVINDDQWLVMLSLVNDLAESRIWLREECAYLFYRILPDLCERKQNLAQLLVNQVLGAKTGLAETPEGIAIWLKAQQQTPPLKLPKGVWHHHNVLNPKESTRLARTMADAAKEAEETHTSGSRAVWRPRLHFAWEVILSHLLSPLSQPNKRCISFGDFWKTVVDQTLFASSSSPERKYLGFLVFQTTLNMISGPMVTSIFTKNFMKCFSNQLAIEDRFLHQMAVRTSGLIVDRVKKAHGVAVNIVAGLVMPPSGFLGHDRTLKPWVKLVRDVSQYIPKHDLHRVLIMYKHIILQKDEIGTQHFEASRRIALDFVFELFEHYIRFGLKSPNDANSDMAFLHELLILFVELGYRNGEDFTHQSTLPSSQRTQREARARLASCLSRLLSTTSDPSTYPIFVVQAIHSYATETDKSMGTPKGDATLQAVHKKIRELEKDHGNMVTTFKLLFSLTMLEVYNGDADAREMLVEIESYYEDTHKSSPNSKAVPGTSQGSPGLIDFILSFLAKPSQLFRRVSNQVFTTCVSNITHEGMQSMLEILGTKETMSGQAEIFASNEGNDDSDKEERIAVGGDDHASSSTNSRTSSDHGSEGVSEVDDNGMGGTEDEDEELAAFDAKLAQALGTKPVKVNEIENNGYAVANGRIQSTAVLESASSSDSSDLDMTDSEMQALDEHLSAVFRERKAQESSTKSKKVEKRDARDTIINFKSRVLELIEIYLKKEPKNAIAFSTIVPLLRCIRMTQSPQVSKKASEAIKQFIKAYKGCKIPARSITNSKALEEVHTEALKDGSNAFGAASSQASLIIVRALKDQGTGMEEISSVYESTMRKATTDSKCKIRPVLFADWLQWCISTQLHNTT